MEFGAGIREAIAEVQAMAAAAIAVRGDKGEPRRLGRRRKIAIRLRKSMRSVVASDKNCAAGPTAPAAASALRPR